MSRQTLRDLPSVERVLEALGARSRLEGIGRALATEIVRGVFDEQREAMLAGAADRVGFDFLLREIDRRICTATRPSLRRVLNASGVLLHTNLGRAPSPTRRWRRSLGRLGRSTWNSTCTPGAGRRARTTSPPC
ncbi:MAG: hypothetical protein QN163_09770 [Armatimonadota bacterium]|nr:hypothetical protein [Armatimonadota bacterium]MDR5697483.1 hypothetical protein [Armatimonadota bacterium]